jgi:hypothetical protein
MPPALTEAGAIWRQLEAAAGLCQPGVAVTRAAGPLGPAPGRRELVLLPP